MSFSDWLTGRRGQTDRTRPRIAILGGGVAGLTTAKFLSERGFADFEIIERSDRVGGKSATVSTPDLIVEMGTCYTTTGHRHVLRWMKQLGIARKRLSTTLVDGENYLKFVKRGSGGPLAWQVVRYLLARHRLLAALESNRVTAARKNEAAKSASAWLADNRLPKMERLMYRAVTSLGYGFLNETSILQAMRWVDVHTILAGAFHLIEMPETGWGPFWEKLSGGFRVETSSVVSSIHRGPDGVHLAFENGTTRTYEYLINTIPLDDLGLITDLSVPEQKTRDAVQWTGFATSTVTSASWFQNADISAYSKAFLPGARSGMIISARYEGYDRDERQHYYVVGQLPGDYSRPELQEILTGDLVKLGVLDGRVIATRIWKYFPRYDRAQIRNSLIEDLSKVQGANRTWHTGATFSHESVANICRFNEKLSERILLRLSRDARGSFRQPAFAANRPA